MSEIKLTKRFPESRPEDITEAYMRGYEAGRNACEKFYAVKMWSDLDDWGETTIERKLYRTREEAERRAEEVEAWSSDEMHYGAMVVEFEVVE